MFSIQNWRTKRLERGATADPIAFHPIGFEILSEGVSPVAADVVFVHGLRGDRIRTWTKDEICWPRDLLAKEEALSHIRVLTFGYDANIIDLANAVSQNTLFEHSQNLLSELARQREGVFSRPIVFVAHSFGGLVVKDALHHSHMVVKTQPHLASTLTATRGIIFFGTPHRGGENAGWSKFIESIARIELRDVNNSLLQDLKRNSPTLDRIGTNFSIISSERSLRIYSFTEELPISSSIGKVVENDSAVIGDAYETRESIHANHIEMVRFRTQDDGGYRAVVFALKTLVGGIVEGGAALSQDNKVRPVARRRGTRNFGENLGMTGVDSPENMDEPMDQLKTFHGSSQDNDLRERIYAWLAAPEPSTNHNAALEKRAYGTGDWFLHGDKYKEWKEKSNLFLWITSLPGGGKTILCSTIIEDLRTACQDVSSLAIAYFYFDFSEPDKLKFRSVLHSLIEQLCDQCSEIPSVLKTLYSNHRNGRQQASVKDLCWALENMIQGFSHVYIVLDALDECDDKNRRDILDFVERILGKKLRGLHLLITSRRISDIQKCLNSVKADEISLENSGNEDIQTFVRCTLESDRNLKEFKDIEKKMIETELIGRSNWMFKWVECQLEELRQCINVAELEDALESLPETLEETYNRILRRIPKRHLKLAHKILQFLAFCTRPMSVRELAEVVAVDTDSEGRLLPINRLRDPEDVLRICPGLITVSLESVDDLTPETVEVARLSHFSVKEYLVSDRITGMGTDIQYYKLSANLAHTFIAQTCLAYLCLFDGAESLGDTTINDFPLAVYSAQNWIIHVLFEESIGEKLQPQLERLLQPCMTFYNWVRLGDVDSFWVSSNVNRATDDIPAPLYYSSLAGLYQQCKVLLNNGADVNATGGNYGSPLQAASRCGHEEVVRVLLEKGADVNLKGGEYGSPLQAAIAGGYIAVGYIAVVRLLLDSGADVNVNGGKYGSPLLMASERGHIEVVRLLLENGVDANASGEEYGAPLLAASEGGHIEVARFLLEKGADVSLKGEEYGDPLQAASECGHIEVVRLLLEKGADMNNNGRIRNGPLLAASEGGHDEVVRLLLENDGGVSVDKRGYDHSLEAACACGHVRVVRLLLENGADVNSNNERICGGPLVAASERGYEEVVRLLLEKGADVNVKGGEYGGPLQAASAGGYEGVVRRLIEAGAVVGKKGGKHGNPLLAASEGGYVEVVRLLLRNGAEVNAEGGDYGDSLQAASAGGHTEVVRLLLEKGADVNAEGGICGGPLLAASEGGHIEVVRLLIENGADVDAKGGIHGGPLQAASVGGHLEVVRLLLGKGADVNAKGGLRGSSLLAASEGGQMEVVRLLLDNGADADAKGGEFDNAMQAASVGGYEEVVRLLLEKGADMNAKGGDYGDSLQAASRCGHEEVVRLLLGNGADVNVKSGIYGSPLLAAWAGGHIGIMGLLLANGAEIMA